MWTSTCQAHTQFSPSAPTIGWLSHAASSLACAGLASAGRVQSPDEHDRPLLSRDGGDPESLRGKSNWVDIVQSSPEPRAQLVDVDKAVFKLEWLLSRRPAPALASAGFSMRGNLASRLTGGGGEKQPALRSPMGPGRTLPPAVVREFEAWLRPVDLATLRPLFDAA